MIIQFKQSIPIEYTLVFESVYPENLRFDLEEKRELFSEPTVGSVYLIADGKVIGECYYIDLHQMKDWEPDEDQPEDGLVDYYTSPGETLYVYSTTILPEYQHMGFGRMLKTWVLSMAKARGYKYVVGHARSGGSMALNKSFGAKIERSFDNWYGTGETYYLYTITL